MLSLSGLPSISKSFWKTVELVIVLDGGMDNACAVANLSKTGFFLPMGFGACVATVGSSF